VTAASPVKAGESTTLILHNATYLPLGDVQSRVLVRHLGDSRSLGSTRRDLTISTMPRLTVRPLNSEDFDGFITYFTRVSKADAERMGLAIDRVPSAAQLRSDLKAMIATPVDRLQSFVLAWCVDGQTIGHSSLKDMVPGESGSIHLHMWRADLRGKGYGPRLFCLSALDFYERYNLKRIICEPKADNPMANRLLQKIGFPLVLTRVGVSSELAFVCELNRYEIQRKIAERYATAHAE